MIVFFVHTRPHIDLDADALEGGMDQRGQMRRKRDFADELMAVNVRQERSKCMYIR